MSVKYINTNIKYLLILIIKIVLPHSALVELNTLSFPANTFNLKFIKLSDDKVFWLIFGLKICVGSDNSYKT